MNIQNASAQVSILPVEASINEAFIPYPDPPKVIRFPEQFDVYMGSCSSCALPVYSSDNYRDEPTLTCSECLHEELSWKVVPATERKAA